VIYCFSDFEFDDERFELRRGGKVVKTEAIALRVLAALTHRAGEVVSKDELIQEVWEGRAVADNVVTVAIARLRKPLNTGQREHILTVYGRGYRFVGPYTTRTAATETVQPISDESHRSPPFVGRERVLARLEQAGQEAQRGHGRVCVLMGEAGIGKTRAVEALQQSLAGSPMRAAWGFCREAGDTPPLSPWLRLLREVTAACGTQRPALTAALSELNELLRPLPQREKPALEEPGTALPNATRHRSFDLFTEAFAHAAEERPWLLVLDDLHRADAGSLELLSYLIEEIAHLGILVVATLRHAPGRRAPRADTHLPYVLGHRNCERIVIERLREQDVAAYVSAVCEDADGQLARAVFAKSEGNPFYMTELSRQLASSERVDTRELAVPSVALDLIRQRVSNLATEPRQVLAAAAVIGRTFELSLLQAVLAQPASALIACLDEAIASDLVVAAPDSSTAFAFGHDLMRAVLYDGLSPPEKRRWHIRTAQALEARIGHGEAVAPSEVAYHLHAGLPESNLRNTVSYCRAAAAAAGAVYAHSDVVRYLHNALEALSLMPTPSVRLRMSMWYLIALYALGRPEGLRATQEVLRLAHEHNDAEMLARAAILLNPYPGMKSMPGARAALEQALAVLGPNDEALRATTLASLACTAPYCYRASETQRLTSEARARADRSNGRAARYVTLVATLQAEGGPHGPSDVEESLIALHGPRPGPRLAVAPLYVQLYRALRAQAGGDSTRALSAIHAGMGHAKTIHHFMQWHFRRLQVVLDINLGAPAKSVPILLRLQHDAQQQRILWSEPYCAFDRLVILPELTDHTPVLEDTLRSPLDYDSADPPAIWAMKVRALVAATLHDEARAVLQNVAARELAELPLDAQYLGTLGHLAVAACELEEHAYAAALHPLLSRFGQHYTAHFTFLSEPVSQVLSRLSSLLGEHGRAVDEARTALAMCERAGLVFAANEARLQLATALLARPASSERSQAITLAREARRSATALGFPRLAGKVEALLAR
jgi:DNA-binding winged helix-turn-helix (wHTH) protein